MEDPIVVNWPMIDKWGGSSGSGVADIEKWRNNASF